MGRSVFLMSFSQITIFPISNMSDGETIAAGINARGFSLIPSEHKLKCVLHMLTYCCQCQAVVLEICMHTWELFPLFVVFRRMLIFSGRAQYWSQRIHIININCNVAITCMAPSPGWYWPVPEVLHEVRQCCHAMGNSRGIKWEMTCPQSLLHAHCEEGQDPNNWNAARIVETPCYSNLVCLILRGSSVMCRGALQRCSTGY